MVGQGRSKRRQAGYRVWVMGSAHATDLTLTVNGERRTVRVDNRMSVLDLLRERLGLTGGGGGLRGAA